MAMVLVFSGHLGTQWFPRLGGVLQAIYTFHMPLFFVLSGLFFHSRYTFAELAAKRARTLLIPYYVFSVLALAKPMVELFRPLAVWLGRRFVGFQRCRIPDVDRVRTGECRIVVPMGGFHGAIGVACGY
jgi:hypothetical protein